MIDRWREKRNVFLLAVCQMLFGSGRMLIVATAPIIGYTFAADKALATLPAARRARPKSGPLRSPETPAQSPRGCS